MASIEMQGAKACLHWMVDNLCLPGGKKSHAHPFLIARGHLFMANLILSLGGRFKTRRETQTNQLEDVGVYPYILPCEAATVFFSRETTVIGPTPPGTGVM